jgi:phosphoribosylaminoimidazolecarboxamide formyltransferase/IMP cyclohydrolase
MEEKYALLSVYEKEGIVEFAKGLIKKGYKIISTGGTAKILVKNDIQVVEVGSITGYPSLFDGRVKTLHPKIAGGILYDRNNEVHVKEADQFNINPIDIVAVNFYPFERVAQNPEATLEDLIEMRDIGGPTMVKEAAKNYKDVIIATDPSQYDVILNALECGVPLAYKEVLAMQAQHIVTNYELLISKTLTPRLGSREVFGLHLTEPWSLKYGRNPHQKIARIYGDENGNLPYEILNGKIGFNNLTDLFQGWQLVRELDESLEKPAVAFMKHSSPAGAAIGECFNGIDMQAYRIKQKEPSELAMAAYKAWETDPKSAYGATSAFSRTIDKSTAKAIRSKNLDCIAAPGFDEDAFKILKKKKNGNMLLVKMDPDYVPPELESQTVYGVTIVQERNDVKIDYEMFKDWDVPSEIKRSMIVAGIATKYSLSNTITMSYNSQLIGSGVGQQSRVDAVKIAGDKARMWFLRRHRKALNLEIPKEVKRAERTHYILDYIENEFSDTDKGGTYVFMEGLKYLCLWSDAFFPFRDGIDTASKYGISYVCQPGGSIRDEEVWEAVKERYMDMFMSGIRLFNN